MFIKASVSICIMLAKEELTEKQYKKTQRIYLTDFNTKVVCSNVIFLRPKLYLISRTMVRFHWLLLKISGYFQTDTQEWKILIGQYYVFRHNEYF